MKGRGDPAEDLQDIMLEGFFNLTEVAEITSAEALLEWDRKLLSQRRAEIGGDERLFERVQISGTGDIRAEQPPDVSRKSLAGSGETGYEPPEKALT